MTSDLLNVLQQIDPNNPFREEDETILAKTAKAKKRKEKREKRLKDCGKFANWYNPHSGKRTGFIFKCGLFRYCKVCLEERADEEASRMKLAALDKRMVVVKCSAKKATNLIRKAEKTEYIRFPQEDGEDLLFLDENLGIEGDAVDLEWVIGQDWKSIVNTPEGRNKSGTMHIPVVDEEVEDFTIINTQQFVTNAERNPTLKAMREAELETADLNPKTPDEVVKALRKRLNIATGKLRKSGYAVNIYNKKLKLVHSMVNWQEGASEIKRNYTENPTRAKLTESIPIPSQTAIYAPT